jgi:hypothetical protein
VFERHIEEEAFDRSKLRFLAAGDGCLGEGEGEGIVGEALGRIAVDRARELIEGDDGGEAGLRALRGPAAGIACGDGFNRGLEAGGDRPPPNQSFARSSNAWRL